MAKTKYTNISSITYRYPIEYTEKNLKPLRLSFLFSLFWFSDGCVRKKHIIPANKNKDVAIGEKQPLKVCPDGTSCWMRSNVADTEEALMPVVHWQVQSVVLLAFVAQLILCVPEVCLFFEFYLLDWVWNFFMKQETFFSQFMQHNLQSNLLNRNIGLRLKQYSIGEKYFHQYFWRCFLLIYEMFPETS